MEANKCPNCNTELPSNLCKCPNCGIGFVDLTSYDFDEGEPFYLKMRQTRPFWGDQVMLTLLVRTKPSVKISATSQKVTINKNGLATYYYVPETNMDIYLCSRYIGDEKTPMAIVEKIED